MCNDLDLSPVLGDTISLNLDRSRVKRSKPIIRSKRSAFEDVCSTLNRHKTPRWADTTAVHCISTVCALAVIYMARIGLSHVARPGRTRARTR